MFRNSPFIAAAALILALAATVLIEQHQLQTQRVRIAAAALQATNLVAERDSTRVITHVLDDSLRLVEKEVVQVAQARDALDKKLGRERLARYAMRTTLDAVRGVAFAPATTLADSAGAPRHADFNLRQVPYTITAHVDIPSAPDSARLDVGVALDPIPMSVRVSCSKPNAAGIRTADVNAVSPRWATVRLDGVEQSPDLCASPALVKAAPTHRRFEFQRLVIGVGRVATPRGWSWGAFFGSGTIIWV